MDSQGKVSFAFFVGRIQLSFTYFRRLDDYRIGGIYYCDQHGRTPHGSSACCKPVGVYCDVGLHFPDVMSDVMGWLGAAPSM